MKNYKSYERIVGLLSAVVRPFVKIEVRGLEHLPKDSGAIIILNHISLLDPVLFGVAVRKKRQVRALAKDSLFRKPVLGKAMANMGHIAVLRGSVNAKDSLALASERLAEGELVGLYPEGTVPETLNKLGEFKTGAARLALASRAPVIPVVSWGAQTVLPRNEGKLKAIFRALFTRPLHRIYIGESLGTFLGDPEDRARVDELTDEFHEAIEGLLPLVKHPKKALTR